MNVNRTFSYRVESLVIGLFTFIYSASANSTAIENSLESYGANTHYEQVAAVQYLERLVGADVVRSRMSWGSLVASYALTLFGGGQGAGLDVVTRSSPEKHVKETNARKVD